MIITLSISSLQVPALHFHPTCISAWLCKSSTTAGHPVPTAANSHPEKQNSKEAASTSLARRPPLHVSSEVQVNNAYEHTTRPPKLPSRTDEKALLLLLFSRPAGNTQHETRGLFSFFVVFSRYHYHCRPIFPATRRAGPLFYPTTTRRYDIVRRIGLFATLFTFATTRHLSTQNTLTTTDPFCK